MEHFHKNPFRILGLPANSSEKELQKQIAIIKRFSEVKQTKTFDYDFTFLGSFIRNEESVKEAASKIEQAQNKVYYALYWFIKNNSIDETAIDYLKANNVNKAVEIWDKVTKAEPNNNNYNAYANLSTLILGHQTFNGSVNIENLKKGLHLKISLINSIYFKDFISLIGADISINTRGQYLEKFLDQVLNLLAKYAKENKITTKQCIEAFKDYPPQLKKIVTERFTFEPIRKIEQKIEETAKGRKKNVREAYTMAEKLYLECRTEIQNLKSILGQNDLQYQTVSNKLASEILQCSIEYFNTKRDETNYDPGDDCLKLTKYADAIATNGPVKHRILESFEFLKGWVEDRPNREMYKIIEEEINFITKQLDRAPKQNYYARMTNQRFDVETTIRYALNANNVITTIDEIAKACFPKLLIMKNKFGKNSEEYIKWCDIVVNVCMGNIIANFNFIADLVNISGTLDDKFKVTVKNTYNTIYNLNSYDMSNSLRNKLHENVKIIGNWNDKLNPKTSFCYVATLVYGNYEHPNVQVLRKFRDEKLLNSKFGKKFIDIYYYLSPILVKRIKTKYFIQRIIREVLNQIVRIIK